MMKVLEVYWDRRTNKTHARVETSEFTDWFFASGRLLSEREFLDAVGPYIQAQIDGLCTLPRMDVLTQDGRLAR